MIVMIVELRYGVHVSQQSCFFVLHPLFPSPIIVLLSVLSLVGASPVDHSSI